LEADPLLTLSGGTAVIGVLILLAAHASSGLRCRSAEAIYFIPVLSLTVCRCAKVSASGRRFVGRLCPPICRRVPDWSVPRGERVRGESRIAKALRTDAKQRAVRIATPEIELEPVMNYYRSRYRQGNWARIERRPPAWATTIMC